MTSPASGTHTRVQMQRNGQALIPHGTLQTYDPTTGAFTAFMDFQAQGEAPYTFTPVPGVDSGFIDQSALPWKMIR